jgi:hypothetical protein
MHQHEKNPANAMNHNQILHAVVSPLTDWGILVHSLKKTLPVTNFFDE